MQTTKERQQLAQSYSYESVSPRALLVGCAIGLGAFALIAVAGLSVEPDASQLADRIQTERARLALSQSAFEHQRELFLRRQEQHGKRAAWAVYASSTELPQVSR